MNKRDLFQQRHEISELKSKRTIERLNAQCDFARSLCELNSSEKKRWTTLIEKAESHLYDKTLDPSSESELRKRVNEAEKILAPISKAAKAYTIHCVGHAHIDMNWMWSWPETVSLTCDTLSTVLKLMDLYPYFTFSQSQASIYRIVEEYMPELLPKIKQRIKEGRWEVTASHWVENDANMANAESLCRHILYTRKYMKQLFDLDAEDVEINWAPDTFGHAATAPSYLVRGGVKYYYLHRPGAWAKDIPPLFWWKAPDGSKVFVRNDMLKTYNGVIEATMADDVTTFYKRTSCKDYMFVYGVGDHGGGPTKRDLVRIKEIGDWPVFPKIECSTVQRFFQCAEKNAKNLPVLDHELNFEFAGCFTSQSLVKKVNRHSENRLSDAELSSSVAWKTLGRKYPHNQLEESWRDTLFSHFHDILPGSGVHDTRTYAHGKFQSIMANTSTIETQSLRQIAQNIDTTSKGFDASNPELEILQNGFSAGSGIITALGELSSATNSDGYGVRPLVVFNTTPWRRKEVVKVRIWENIPVQIGPDMDKRNYVVILPDGKRIQAQVLYSAPSWNHQFVELAFPVDVPSMGYTTYHIMEDQSESPKTELEQLRGLHNCFYSSFERAMDGIENQHIRLEIDPHHGGISKLIHKKSKLVIIEAQRPSAAAEFIMERTRGMNSWLIEHHGGITYPHVESITPKHRGPHLASIEVKYKIGQSNFTVTYELKDDDPKCYMNFEVNWHELGTNEKGVPCLRLSIPTKMEKAKASYEIPFGAIERQHNQNEEVAALQWAKLDGKIKSKACGYLLINESKYGHSLDGNTMRLNLIRSSTTPDPIPEIMQHKFEIAIHPFAGQMDQETATAQARAFNHPMRVITTDQHKGAWPKQDSFITSKTRNIVISGVKKAENSDALIIRLYNTSGKTLTANLQLADSIRKGLKKAQECDLMERPIKKSRAKLNAKGFSISLPAHGIASVCLTG